MAQSFRRKSYGGLDRFWGGSVRKGEDYEMRLEEERIEIKGVKPRTPTRAIYALIGDEEQTGKKKKEQKERSKECVAVLRILANCPLLSLSLTFPYCFFLWRLFQSIASLELYLNENEYVYIYIYGVTPAGSTQRYYIAWGGGFRGREKTENHRKVVVKRKR